MAAAPPFPRLFSPIRLRGRLIANRIVRLPTNSVMAERNRPTEAMTAHYARLAAGGPGIVVTEAFAAHPASTRGPRLVALFDREAIPSLSRLAGAVQWHGAALIAQVVFGGTQHHSTRDLPLLWGASAVACAYSGGVPHPMTQDEIEDVIAHFALSAANAQEAGLAGVEIHGAQGYLIQQFLSPLSNRRTDEYGGSFANRIRLAERIVAAVRAAVGPDFIVGYRAGIEDFIPGGLTLEDGQRVVAVLAATGALDYLSLSQGNFASIEQHLPDRHFPPGAFIPAQAAARAAAGGLPCVASGRIMNPDQAESILASGSADFVGLSRALTADPDWPVKAAAGRAGRIRPCIACNECWGAITAGERLRCTVNPACGQETAAEPGALPPGCKVLVIGAGPAGLQAALDAALRGAAVRVIEAADAAGGKLRIARSEPHQAELGLFSDWLLAEAEAAGVAFRFGVADAMEAVREERPDQVILATGASGVAVPVPTDGSLVAWTDAGLALPVAPGSRVVVMDEDGHNWAAAACEALVERGHRVTLATRFFEPLRALPTVSRIAALRALHAADVGWLANVEVVRIAGGCAVLRNHVTAAEDALPADAVVWIGRQRPDDALAAAIRRVGVPVTVVGDAQAPRRLTNAIGEGQRAAYGLRATPARPCDAPACRAGSARRAGAGSAD